MKHIIYILIVMLAMPSAFGQPADVESGASPVRERPNGYLADGEHPDTVALLPPPPAAGSAAFAHDEAHNEDMLTLRGTPRWDMAAQDAIPEPGRGFTCALGMTLSAQDTPSIYNLLRRSVADVGPSVTGPKRHYQRKRPFLINEQPTCVPRSEETTALDGAYPSGHTAAGWVWALILGEVAPDRVDAVLARGWEYGRSRAVCNVHWYSDVVAGRIVGAALVARLHANEEFRADLETARKEYATLREKGASPDLDCEAEAKAFAD